MSKYILRMAFASFLLFSACCDPISETHVENTLVERLVLRESDFTIYAQPGVKLSQILKASVFAPLRPGVTFEEAEKLIRPVGAVEQDQEQRVNMLLSYMTPEGKLQVIRQTVESESPERVSWMLRFAPTVGRLEDFLALEVREVLPPERTHCRLTILEAGDCSAMARVDIEERKIKFIYWLCEECC